MNTKQEWFALRVRSRCEKLAAKDLEGRGYEICTACAPQRRVWADRVRTVEMPMFPGYIFTRFEASQAYDVLKAPGIASIVGFGSRFCPVDEAEIEAIRLVLASGVPVSTHLQLRPGARVRVLHGSLKGLEGTLIEIKNERRLVVSVSLLQRSVAVEISDLLVEPVRTSAVAA